MELRWPSLEARLRGRRIAGLRYDPEAGFVVVELTDGAELWVSADREGCQTFDEPKPRRAVYGKAGLWHG